MGKSRLALDELQMHQPARRIINEHLQGALRFGIGAVRMTG